MKLEIESYKTCCSLKVFRINGMYCKLILRPSLMSVAKGNNLHKGMYCKSKDEDYYKS